MIEAMNDSSQSDYSWCKKLFDELDPPDSVIAGTAFDVEKEPEWAQKVLGQLMQQAMPAFSLRKPKGMFPRELGLYLGQQCGNVYAIGNMIQAPTTKNVRQGKKVLEVYERNRHLPGVESTLMMFEQLGSLMKGFGQHVELFETVLHKAFKTALDQPSREQAAEFFQGFAKGISKPGVSKQGLTGSTTATLIYEKLWTHRRQVEKLKGYAELTEFLIRNGVAKNVVGSARRIQKLCERVGLHLGKRGRPRK